MAKRGLTLLKHRAGRDRPARRDGERPEHAEVAASLRQLLTVATLTPQQAVLLARDVASGLDALHYVDPGVGLDIESVRVTACGQVRFDPLWNGDAGCGTNAGGVGAVAQVLRELSVNARRCGPRHREMSARLVRHLDDVHGELSDVADQLRTLAAELLEEETGRQTRQARRGLAALVQASLRVDPDQRGEVEAFDVVRADDDDVVIPRVAKLPRGDRVPLRRVYHRRRSRVRWRLVLTVLTVVALVTAGWWFGPRVWEQVRESWDAVFSSSEPPPVQLAPVSPPPESEEAEEVDPAGDEQNGAVPAEVERPAPDSAGPINEVSMETTSGACEPAQACSVRVEVRLERATATRQVAWAFEVVDRCSGEAHTLPGASVTAQAGWTQVWANSVVDVPEGTALAVMAVTESPDRASSSPLLVPEGDGSC